MAVTRVRCGGVWLDALGYVGDLEWVTRAPAATSVSCSWRMALPPLFEHPAIRRGADVGLWVGPQRIWRGILNEPTPTAEGWEFHASGDAEDAEDYLALNSSGGTTSTPNVAIDEAISRGLRWTRTQSISATALKTGDTTDALNELGAILDDFAEGAGRRWGVRPSDGDVVCLPDPTEPTWHIHPRTALPATADDEYVTHLYGRYQSGATPDTFATVIAGNATQAARFGRVEEEVDLTPLGVISSSRAQAEVDGMLALCKAELSWADAIEVTRNEITTGGGTSADLRFVQGGQLVRMHGLVARDGSRLYADFVIGESHHREGDPLVTLSPTEKAGRTLAEILSVEAPPKKKRKKKRRKRRRRMRR